MRGCGCSFWAGPATIFGNDSRKRFRGLPTLKWLYIIAPGITGISRKAVIKFWHSLGFSGVFRKFNRRPWENCTFSGKLSMIVLGNCLIHFAQVTQRISNKLKSGFIDLGKKQHSASCTHYSKVPPQTDFDYELMLLRAECVFKRCVSLRTPNNSQNVRKLSCHLGAASSRTGKATVLAVLSSWWAKVNAPFLTCLPLREGSEYILSYFI